MKGMIQLLKNKGYKQTSLSVQKVNYVVRVYRKVGFEVIDESDKKDYANCL
ncbi:GNAT family N-acetyltransferase [Hominifimenecus sp. rT4P-3]|uniref:GNAT family N-acetyltransferase n=1 Tax=Hominifimenecus sp. rT4P-3 TaxID=3242979 RepID=UPI003DA3563F